MKVQKLVQGLLEEEATALRLIVDPRPVIHPLDVAPGRDQLNPLRHLAVTIQDEVQAQGKSRGRLPGVVGDGEDGGYAGQHDRGSAGETGERLQQPELRPIVLSVTRKVVPSAGSTGKYELIGAGEEM